MANIVVEKRTFINKDKHEQLMQTFMSRNCPMKKTNQIIYQYKSELDFRLTFDTEQAMLRLRGLPTGGEKIIHIAANEVTTLTEMLRHLGMYEDIKWYRIRTVIPFAGYIITMDETYQYGYVTSIAKEVPVEMKEKTTEELNKIFEQLQITITTKEQFIDRHKYYRMKWVDFSKNIDEQAFINRD